MITGSVLLMSALVAAGLPWPQVQEDRCDEDCQGAVLAAVEWLVKNLEEAEGFTGTTTTPVTSIFLIMESEDGTRPWDRRRKDLFSVALAAAEPLGVVPRPFFSNDPLWIRCSRNGDCEEFEGTVWVHINRVRREAKDTFQASVSFSFIQRFTEPRQWNWLLSRSYELRIVFEEDGWQVAEAKVGFIGG
jgi:hypothetical protein